MDSTKLAYSDVLKGKEIRKNDKSENFEEIEPKDAHSSFECLAGIKSEEEFDLLEPLEVESLTDSTAWEWGKPQELHEGDSSEFELLDRENGASNIIRQTLDHASLTGAFDDNASLLQNFLADIQGTSTNPSTEMALLPYGERAVLPYGERAVVPYKPVPIYSVGQTKALQGRKYACAPHRSFDRQESSIKHVKAEHIVKHPEIIATKTSKRMCRKCLKNRHCLNTTAHALSQAKQEVIMLRKHVAQLEDELLEQSVLSDQLSATIKGLALDSFHLSQANETLYQEKTKLSAEAETLRDAVDAGESRVKGLEQQVAGLVTKAGEINLQCSNPSPAEASEQAEEWSTATNKKTNKLQKTVAVQKKSIAELQQERQQVLEKLHQAQAEVERLQELLDSTSKEKDADISNLKDENYDLYFKIQTLETKCQDCLNQMLTAKQENKKAEEEHSAQEKKLQQQISSLENALEAAKLIQQQHKRRSSVSVQAAVQQNSCTTQTTTSATSAHGWSEFQDNFTLCSAPDIASGTPLDLSLGDRTDENGNPVPSSSTVCDSESTSRSSVSCRGGKAPAGRKPRKFHFKVINPAKDYPIEYTPRLYGGKCTREPSKPAKKTQDTGRKCPHCLMNFPKNCDPITIQKHVMLHKIR